MESRKFSEETLTAVVKKKNILLVIEYCLENKIEFVVTPGAGSDDFLIGFVIKELGAAVALGMSLKDLKIDLQGLPGFISVNQIRSKKGNESTPAKGSKSESRDMNDELEIPTMENALKFDLENA